VVTVPWFAAAGLARIRGGGDSASVCVAKRMLELIVALRRHRVHEAAPRTSFHGLRRTSPCPAVSALKPHYY
jgi:hypothetical protein